MASMTINIDNFSEEQINEFCTKKFAELSDDVIEKIFTEAIRQRIEQSDLVIYFLGGVTNMVERYRT